MSSEKQYIDLFEASKALICSHSAAALNAVRDQAFDDFKRQGFPSRKVERYKYTDMAELFAPDYGLNLSRLDIPVDPYSVFSCDVPNLSTSLSSSLLTLLFIPHNIFFNLLQYLPYHLLPYSLLTNHTYISTLSYITSHLFHLPSIPLHLVSSDTYHASTSTHSHTISQLHIPHALS